VLRGRGVRAWLLVRLGSDWRNAVTSAVIDRGVGVGLLIVLGFVVVLLLPSGLTALGGYRDVVLVVYGALILAGALGLLLAPKVVPTLARWRYSRWCFGLALAVGSLPGALAWAFVSIRARSAFCRARWVKGARHVASGHAVGRRAGYR
jgi:hypothetical protein